MTRTPEQIVSAEVHYCVSYLVSTLASGGMGIMGNLGSKAVHDMSALSEACEQAFGLACPIDDYEEAATQAGWTREVSRMAGTVTFMHPEHGRVLETDGWQGICEGWDIEPYQREVFEHWIVSNWLAEQLAERGEKVDTDFAGMTVWARTTTGQGIASDSVIEQIAADMAKRYGGSL